MRAHHYAGAVLPSDPGLRFSFGFTGSGKTFGTRAQVFAALRASPPLAVLALDPTAEWSSVPRDLAPVTAGARDIATAARHVRGGARLVIVRAPEEEPRELLEAACAWAREHAAAWRSRSPGRHALAGIMAPEAHRCAPVRFHELPRHTSAVATAWRHERVALWLDTQRPALVSTTLRELARETRYYAQGDPTSLGLPRDLVAALEECARRYDSGEPGWHVRVGLTPRPPYKITRATV